MVKPLTLLFLLFTQSLALDIKMRAIQTDDVIKVGAKIKHPMITFDKAEQRRANENSAHFIRHITAQVNDYIVFDVTTSPFLSKDPVIKFSYGYKGRGNNLKIIAIDNKNETFKRTRKVENSLYVNEVLHPKIVRLQVKDFRKSNPKIWQVISMEKAIKELYGKIEPIEDKLTLNIQKGIYEMEDGVCFNFGKKTPVNIKSDVNLTSLAIFQDMTDYPTIAVFNTPKNRLIDYTLNINVGKGNYSVGNIVIIAQDVHGKHYIKRQKVYIVNTNHTNCDGSHHLD
jgi:sulfur-oxidizing protein SoxZ